MTCARVVVRRSFVYPVLHHLWVRTGNTGNTTKKTQTGNNVYIVKTEVLRITSLTALLLGVAGLAGIMVLDIVYWRTGIISEGWPDISPSHLLRSLVIFVSLSSMAWGILGDCRQRFMLSGGDNVVFVRLSIMGVLTLSVGFLLLFLFKPSVFNSIAAYHSLVLLLS